MLLLSRKRGERIIIGDNTTIVVTRITNNRVVIGVEAPADVRIVREEIQPGRSRSGMTTESPRQEKELTTVTSIESPPCESDTSGQGSHYLARRARTAISRRRALRETAPSVECAGALATV